MLSGKQPECEGTYEHTIHSRLFILLFQLNRHTNIFLSSFKSCICRTSTKVLKCTRLFKSKHCIITKQKLMRLISKMPAKCREGSVNSVHYLLCLLAACKTFDQSDSCCQFYVVFQEPCASAYGLNSAISESILTIISVVLVHSTHYL